MSFPCRSPNWNRYQPRDLKDAFRAGKEFAREKKRYSTERIAELMGVTPDTLYKWLGDAKMPAAMIPVFEHVTGAHFVTEYLAAGEGRMVIRIPAGHNQNAEDLAELQALVAAAVAHLCRCYRGQASIEETKQELTECLRDLAWHRENVAKLERPELDLDLEEADKPARPSSWKPGWMPKESAKEPAQTAAQPAVRAAKRESGHA